MGTVFRRLLRNVNLLNMALLAVAVVLWMRLGVSTPGQVGLSFPPPPSPHALEEKKPQEATPSMADFLIVAENNLFHPERKIPPEKKDDAALVRPEIVLYGTMINNDMSVAFIEDKKSPRTTPGRGQRQLTAKKGDVFGGFVVVSIEKDRIRLSRGTETMIVNLMDEAKRRSTDAPQTPGAGAAAARARLQKKPTPGH